MYNIARRPQYGQYCVKVVLQNIARRPQYGQYCVKVVLQNIIIKNVYFIVFMLLYWYIIADQIIKFCLIFYIWLLEYTIYFTNFQKIIYSLYKDFKNYLPAKGLIEIF